MVEEIIVWLIIGTVIVMSGRSLYRTLTTRETTGCGGCCGNCGTRPDCTGILPHPEEKR